jgi:2-oxoacid:acceptor oxidoreductase delta subunit (pyruvate/2-ketoisovalerate family)
MDCARSCLRLGATDVTALARAEELAADPEQVEQARAEGLKALTSCVVTCLEAEGGRVKGVRGIKIRWEKPDASGRRTYLPVPGTEFRLEADTVIIAIGQRPDLAFLPSQRRGGDGRISIGPDGGTSLPHVFAGGDAASGVPMYVADAIGSGRRAALAIDSHLRNVEAGQAQRLHVVRLEEMNAFYFGRRARIPTPQRPPAQRVRDFLEVCAGYDEKAAVSEAERCLSCGVCNECGNCWLYCPDMAVVVKDGGYEVDYDYCKGCGICAEECPRRVIDMVPEG